MNDASKCHTEPTKEFVFVAVDGAITSQSPRAWVFETEEEAVKFRTEKLEAYSRRRGSLAPVYRVEVGCANESAMLEIDWSKHQLPKREEKKKFM